MEPPTPATPMTDRDRDIVATVLRERSRLANFIRHSVRDRTDAEDILQDVFEAFIEAYRLPEPIEQVSAWLFRVARHRIVDRFRKKKEQSTSEPTGHDHNHDDDGDEGAHRLDLALPSPEGGPEAHYARSRLLEAMEQALAELPENQRDVFVAHELDGIGFKEIAARSGVAVNTLLARKRYAVLHLRARLQAAYDELGD
jgi:RNA polymerase sigma factor (sigma-70 family)